MGIADIPTLPDCLSDLPAINVGDPDMRHEEATMIYELRIYHCVSGRLPALLKRFETTTLELWKRHGIRQAGFWTVLVGDGGNQDLHYLLAWESLAEREAKWNKFMSDPEWLESARKRARRTDHFLNQEHVPAADGVLGGAVKAAFHARRA